MLDQRVIFSPSGMLRERMLANFDRLEESRYQPSHGDLNGGGALMQGYAWPGDIEGRIVLALTLLEQASGRKAKYLNALIEVFPSEMNEKGYFGTVDSDLVDEQQLSGHGWLLRGLCEHYRVYGDAASLGMIRDVVKNLALPTLGRHAAYSMDPAKRDFTLGHVLGEQGQVINGWRLSSDIGCNFIFMDGLMQAAILLDDPKVKEVVEEILTQYVKLDVRGICAQTHSTLTGVRAILRWYAHTQRTELLEIAIKRFNLYCSEGCSESYGNWNWFGRPSHTEPCGMIDSFMVAMQLWSLTGEVSYLEFAHRTWHTALGHAQRGNGGFGCDTVTGAPESKSVDTLKVLLDEAWFCCTMRAAEGFYEAVRWSAVEKDGRLCFPLLNSGQVEWNGWVLDVESAYPWKGSVSVTVKRAGSGVLPLSFYVPPWAEHRSAGGFHEIDLRPEAGQTWAMEFAQKPRIEKPHNVSTDPDYVSIWQGPVQFGTVNLEQTALPEGGLNYDTAHQTITAGTVCLTPVNDMNRRSAVGYERRVLFKEKGIK